MVNYKTWKNRLFNFVVVLLLVLITLACLLPLLHIVALSFSSKNAAVSGKVTFWPVEITLASYEYLLEDSKKSLFVVSDFLYVVWCQLGSVVFRN